MATWPTDVSCPTRRARFAIAARGGGLQHLSSSVPLRKGRGMFRSIAARALWLTKGAALFGGAVVTLALVLGVGTMALAAVPGDPFRLGQTNGIDNFSTLVGNVATPIL